MTDVDHSADIETHSGPEFLGVRIPLGGHVPGEFLRYYQKLADDKQVPAQAEDLPDRSWIIVRLPAVLDAKRVVAMLDAACDLVTEADALANAAPATAKAEAAVHEWWAARRR